MVGSLIGGQLRDEGGGRLNLWGDSTTSGRRYRHVCMGRRCPGGPSSVKVMTEDHCGGFKSRVLLMVMNTFGDVVERWLKMPS
jgi:hypothetical protein